MRIWRRQKPRTINELAKPFPTEKERRFQEWLKCEQPHRPELQGVHVAFQRASFELQDKSPSSELAHVLAITHLHGSRFQAAIDNMKAGRALEYRNIRFRKTGFLTITANVQVYRKSYSLTDAEDAFIHAEKVFAELKQHVQFRKATRFHNIVFQLAAETHPKSLAPDQIFYQKRGNKIIRVPSDNT